VKHKLQRTTAHGYARRVLEALKFANLAAGFFKLKKRIGKNQQQQQRLPKWSALAIAP